MVGDFSILHWKIGLISWDIFVYSKGDITIGTVTIKGWIIVAQPTLYLLKNITKLRRFHYNEQYCFFSGIWRLKNRKVS